MDATSYLENLPDELMVAVNFSTVSGEIVKKNGMALNTDPPALEIRFGPDFRIEAEKIDFSADCLVFIETGEIVTLICTLEEVPEPSALLLTVRDLVQHVEKREYFRSPADRLAITWYRKNERKKNRQKYDAKGINISSGGMLVMTVERVDRRERLVFEVVLPEPAKKTITCDATVLRVENDPLGRLRVAVRFENSHEIGDDIMGYCFAEQRRLLREKVVTKDLL